MFDYAVVGGGIGGVVSASLLSKMGRRVVLFEKLDYLGGCAGTFSKDGRLYNVGATTLVGIKDSLPLGVLLSLLGIDSLPVKPIDPAIVVYVNSKVINRYRDKSRSLEEIQRSFYNRKNPYLWKEIFKTADRNWKEIYSLLPFRASFLGLLRSGLKNIPFVIGGVRYNLTSAKKVITSYLGNIEDSYIMFLNSQILMTTQGYWDEVAFSTASMGLSYPNLDNYYVLGGMGSIFNLLIRNIESVYLRTSVKKIDKVKGIFRIHTNRGAFEAKRVILNKTIWDFCSLFDDDSLKLLCERYKKRYSKIWSSATLYFCVEDGNNLLDKHHYQILHSQENPYTGSYSFFVSLSDMEDSSVSKDGWKSVTISTHCKIDRWTNLNMDEYEERKEMLREFILQKLYEYIPIFKTLKKSEVMVGTPKSFQRFTSRYGGSVGGLPLLLEYVPFRYPKNETPIQGVYLLGDTVFPGQGWPGVIVGVFNLLLQIEKEFYGILHKHIK
ncbi:MAG: NAD(P)/FAD-dependent oxidoreductase [Hydrogenothermaceae bacterium]|nr:NAD(P)/FAD-dependent oxidoreductase [Hydrogenothermaceae bacterium]